MRRVHRGDPLQDVGEFALVLGIEMLHEDEGHAGIRWQVLQKRLKRAQPACARADTDDGEVQYIIAFLREVVACRTVRFGRVAGLLLLRFLLLRVRRFVRWGNVGILRGVFAWVVVSGHGGRGRLARESECNNPSSGRGHSMGFYCGTLLIPHGGGHGAIGAGCERYTGGRCVNDGGPG